MEKNKEEFLIIYLDDNDEKQETWSEIISFKHNYIKFYDPKKNTILIPTHRLLKIKKRK